MTTLPMKWIFIVGLGIALWLIIGKWCVAGYALGVAIEEIYEKWVKKYLEQ